MAESAELEVPVLGAPGRSYALLIGVSEFSDSASYQPLPSTFASVEKLGELLRATGDGLPTWQHVEVLGPCVTADAAREALEIAVSAPRLNELIVCISCHGHRYSEDGHHRAGLHLVMTNSVQSRPGSHWHFDEVRNVLEAAANKIKHILLIVDACWADGVSIEPGQGGGEQVQLDNHLAVPGVVVLTATKYRVMAWPHWPDSDGVDTGWTAFLGALIDSIEHGVSGSAPTLTVGAVYWEARRQIIEAQKRERRIPTPEIRTSGMAEFPLCRNKGYSKQEDLAEGAIDAALTFANAKICFEAINECRHSERDGQIPSIIERFCGNADVAQDEIAQLIERLRSKELSRYLDHAYAMACSNRSAASIAIFVDRLHRNGVPIGREIYSTLRSHSHPGRVMVDVYLALLANKCAACEQVAEAISARLLDDDPNLSAAALAVWR